MHDQVGVWYTGIDLLDAVNGENIASGRAGEFVGAMAGAAGDGQGINLGRVDPELSR